MGSRQGLMFTLSYHALPYDTKLKKECDKYLSQGERRTLREAIGYASTGSYVANIF
jgi:hypothetical protein